LAFEFLFFSFFSGQIQSAKELRLLVAGIDNGRLYILRLKL